MKPGSTQVSVILLYTYLSVISLNYTVGATPSYHLCFVVPTRHLASIRGVIIQKISGYFIFLGTRTRAHTLSFTIYFSFSLPSCLFTLFFVSDSFLFPCQSLFSRHIRMHQCKRESVHVRGQQLDEATRSHPVCLIANCRKRRDGTARWRRSSPRRRDPLQPISPLIYLWERQSGLMAPQVNKRWKKE